ncbi:hypothetical protein [Maribacter hydrothermalis]|uniref:Uncharacterized protein n=1 Tax=Maribacter hydrothermalis TaxID=1836467 RepID=A0A1B7YYV1_9FLAO|nr:hypothetical protein [Maribacter hydrothermalis]APQ16174.1 hypothetical protein BTR34_01890 [Maribacter hydrothermalis]OBR35649.1 hypothetical protein A9200_10625 [Maribacter hydrothermalis]
MNRKLTNLMSYKQKAWIESLLKNKEIKDLESYLLDLIDKEIALNDKWLNVYRAINKDLEN